MPRYLLNIDPGDDRRIRRLIGLGVYQDLDHIVSVALRNQLVAEEQGIDQWRDSSAGSTTAAAIVPERGPDANNSERDHNRTLAGPLENLVTLDGGRTPAIVAEPRDANLAGTIFWAQYYKNLPLKVA